MKTVNYLEHSATWPSDGKHILAEFNEETITVYQAYNEKISEAIVNNQNLHSEECLKSGYSLTRMSWIKTNFLWMMYRSNWAQTKNQERILAFRITRQGFDEILEKAVISSVGASMSSVPEKEAKWKESIKSAHVVLQWDPDHLPNGQKVKTRRAIQLGMRDEMLLKFSKDFIVNVTDITDFVREQRERCMVDGKPFEDLSRLEIPNERPYIPLNRQIAEHVKLTLEI